MALFKGSIDFARENQLPFIARMFDLHCPTRDSSQFFPTSAFPLDAEQSSLFVVCAQIIAGGADVARGVFPFAFEAGGEMGAVFDPRAAHPVVFRGKGDGFARVGAQEERTALAPRDAP